MCILLRHLLQFTGLALLVICLLQTLHETLDCGHGVVCRSAGVFAGSLVSFIPDDVDGMSSHFGHVYVLLYCDVVVSPEHLRCIQSLHKLQRTE